MGNVMLKILALTTFFLSSCSPPTAPGPLIDWSRTAPGCSPRRPIVAPTQQWDTSDYQQEGKLLTLVYIRANDMLFAEFVRNADGVYELCEWDTSDN